MSEIPITMLELPPVVESGLLSKGLTHLLHFSRLTAFEFERLGLTDEIAEILYKTMRGQKMTFVTVPTSAAPTKLYVPRPTTARARVLEFVNENPLCTRNGVAEGLNTFGPRGTFTSSLSALVTRGVLRLHGSRRYTATHWYLPSDHPDRVAEQMTDPWDWEKEPQEDLYLPVTEKEPLAEIFDNAALAQIDMLIEQKKKQRQDLSEEIGALRQVRAMLAAS